MADPDPSTPSPRPDPSRRRDTRDPHRSRERALKVLFQADVRGQRPVETLQRIVHDEQALAMLDDLDLDAADQDRRDREQLAKADAEAGTTLRSASSAPPLDLFSRSLVEGVDDHLEAIDALINEVAHGWTVKRMPVIDRNVLRLAVHELLHEDTPAPIVIDEALGFVKALSTDRSSGFVNGVLETIRREHAPGAQRG